MKTKSRSVKTFAPYFVIIVFLAILSLTTNVLFDRMPHLEESEDFQLLILGGIIFIGYYINRIAPRTIIPSFVWAIFAGMALYPILSVYTEDISSLKP